ncbi:MAG: hypothetical protein HRT77_00220 [Halioglobus sp.]|nr:hypothetical protein [Halioglobus sp.]
MIKEQERVRFRGLRSIAPLVIVMILAFIPFSGKALGVAKLQLADILIPLIFGYSVVNAVLTKNLSNFLPTKGNLHFLFIALFMFVVLISYVRNPVMASSLVGGSDGGLKHYWRFLCSLFTFLTALYWLHKSKIPIAQALDILFYIALGVTLLGLFMLFTGLSLPGLDTHAWSVNKLGGSGVSAGSTRMPFLEVFAQLGFILTLSNSGRGYRFRKTLVGYFGLCIVLGGGRVGLLSTLVCIAIWMFLNRRFLLTGFMVSTMILMVVFVQVIHEMAPPGNLKRLTKLGSLEQTSPARYKYFLPMFEEIIENPVIGTGYGKTYEFGLIRDGSRFVSGETLAGHLRIGSHTTHLNILKNLGIVGYLPFVLIWLYPIITLLPYAMGRLKYPSADFSRNAQFFVLIISGQLIRMLVEGNGTEKRLYIYAAIACGLIDQLFKASDRPMTVHPSSGEKQGGLIEKYGLAER